MLLCRLARGGARPRVRRAVSGATSAPSSGSLAYRLHLRAERLPQPAVVGRREAVLGAGDDLFGEKPRAGRRGGEPCARACAPGSVPRSPSARGRGTARATRGRRPSTSCRCRAGWRPGGRGEVEVERPLEEVALLDVAEHVPALGEPLLLGVVAATARVSRGTWSVLHQPDYPFVVHATQEVRGAPALARADARAAAAAGPARKPGTCWRCRAAAWWRP